MTPEKLLAFAAIGVLVALWVIDLCRPNCDHDERYSPDREKPRSGVGKQDVQS